MVFTSTENEVDPMVIVKLGKTMILSKGTTDRHVYDQAQFFLQDDLNLQDIEHGFTLNIFSVQGIEVLGTPIGTDTYIKDYVGQNCVKIVRNMEKHDRYLPKSISLCQDSKKCGKA